jgi:DNA polymerase (family 10)
MMENAAVADFLDEVADLLELKKSDSFRIRAYRNAARSVRTLGVRVADLVERGADLKQIPGIGSTIADEIKQLQSTGTTDRRDQLREGVPPGLLELLRLPGIGPRKAWDLWTKAQVGSIADLRAAVEAKRIREIPGMGEKTEETLRKALATAAPEGPARLFWKDARAHLEAIGSHLASIDAIARWEAAGSFRRRRETIGDLDVLVEPKDRALAAEGILGYPGIAEVLGRGEGGVRVKLSDGIQVDLRFVEAAGFGAAQMYFTGSKAHNIELRQRAIKRGFKLNEYGLYDRDEKRVAGKTEQAVYKKLGLPWIAPELREAEGEIDAAERGELPDLIEIKDLRGDLHAHTVASDGRNTLQQMVEAARARGYAYLAITDHSKLLRMTNGLDELRLAEHAARIREVDATLDDFTVLAGVEVDILADGALDLELDALAALDWVVASLHSALDLDQGPMTDRVVAAIGSGVVDCIGHPFARRLDRRPPVKLDFERVVAACVEHGVALEINGSPHRLDLPWNCAKAAREAGVKLVLSTDAHRVGELDHMEYAVGEARRGWVEKKDVLNTMDAVGLKGWLSRRHQPRR